MVDTCTFYACYTMLLLLVVLTSCANAVPQTPQAKPAPWHQQLRDAQAYIARRNADAILTQVKAERGLDSATGDYRTLHVRFHFVSPTHSHWVTLDDTNPAGTVGERGGGPNDGNPVSATYRQQLQQKLINIQLSAADVVQCTLPEAQRRGFNDLNYAPDIDLRLRLDRSPIRWSIEYSRHWNDQIQTLTFDVNAQSGQIMEQWTYPEHLPE